MSVVFNEFKSCLHDWLLSPQFAQDFICLFVCFLSELEIKR